MTNEEQKKLNDFIALTKELHDFCAGRDFCDGCPYNGYKEHWCPFRSIAGGMSPYAWGSLE